MADMRAMPCFLAAGYVAAAHRAPQEPVWSLARKERPAVVETLRELAHIESGSRDKEGPDRMRERGASYNLPPFQLAVFHESSGQR
jgi:glutamate carboxypeptidase